MAHVADTLPSRHGQGLGSLWHVEAIFIWLASLRSVEYALLYHIINYVHEVLYDKKTSQLSNLHRSIALKDLTANKYYFQALEATLQIFTPHLCHTIDSISTNYLTYLRGITCQSAVISNYWRRFGASRECDVCSSQWHCISYFAWAEAARGGVRQPATPRSNAGRTIGREVSGDTGATITHFCCD